MCEKSNTIYVLAIMPNLKELELLAMGLLRSWNYQYDDDDDVGNGA
jgi:hypothetical protein